MFGSEDFLDITPLRNPKSWNYDDKVYINRNGHTYPWFLLGLWYSLIQKRLDG